jgi:hypothetical protein
MTDSRFHRFIDWFLTSEDVAYGLAIVCFATAFLMVAAALIVTIN